jgi:predicted acylesterase/phospholipase RssA
MQMATIVWFAVGCIAGALVGWLFANGRAQGELAGLRAKLDAAGEKMQALSDVEKNLKESFASLAASALDANPETDGAGKG